MVDNQSCDVSLIPELLKFLEQSPTPYHAARSLATMLSNAGFLRLDERESWDLVPGGRYYVIRGGSSIIAFVNGINPIADTGLRVIGAHTDSPCLKVKPQPDIHQKTYCQLGVEVYGGALLNPWFDRDLSVAGIVSYIDKQGGLQSKLIDFSRAIACVPNLAIHLDREANQNRSVNPQTDMNAIISIGAGKASFRDMLLDELGEEQALEVLDYSLSFYDTQRPSVVGIHGEFIASARLDNLLSCFLGAKALIQASEAHTSVLICNDHEEVGSNTDIGAQGPLLTEVIDRLTLGGENRQLAMRRSVMLSVDNAHGVHPNYSAKHDEQHGPLLNRGPVIKFDANQSYATSSASASLVRWLAQADNNALDIPLQTYATRADMRCGSTIGPLTASAVGIMAVDIGVPTFAMHSIRELAGSKDVAYMNAILSRFVVLDELPLVSSIL